MRDLLVVGTGPSLLTKVEKIRNFEGDVLAWSHAHVFLLQKDIIPKFWSYVDPHSSIAAFKHLFEHMQKIDTTLLLFSPALTTTYKAFNQYIGTAQDMDSVGYEERYMRWLDAVFPLINIQEIEIDTTRRNSKLDKNQLYYEDEKLILNHTYAEDKLLFCVLPLVKFLGYKDITLVGFDGKGPRYMAKKPIPHNISAIQKLRSTYLEQWKSEIGVRIL